MGAVLVTGQSARHPRWHIGLVSGQHAERLRRHLTSKLGKGSFTDFRLAQIPQRRHGQTWMGRPQGCALDGRNVWLMVRVKDGL